MALLAALLQYADELLHFIGWLDRFERRADFCQWVGEQWSWRTSCIPFLHTWNPPFERCECGRKGRYGFEDEIWETTNA
jgi:hypothetical protein